MQPATLTNAAWQLVARSSSDTATGVSQSSAVRPTAGLYLALEKVWHGKRRVNIAKYDPVTSPTGAPQLLATAVLGLAAVAADRLSVPLLAPGLEACDSAKLSDSTHVHRPLRGPHVHHSHTAAVAKPQPLKTPTLTGGFIFRIEHGKPKNVPEVDTRLTGQIILVDDPRTNVSDASLQYLTQ